MIFVSLDLENKMKTSEDVWYWQIIVKTEVDVRNKLMGLSIWCNQRMCEKIRRWCVISDSILYKINDVDEMLDPILQSQ